MTEGENIMKSLSILCLFLLSLTSFATDVDVSNGLQPKGKTYDIQWKKEVQIVADGSADHLTWKGSRVMVQVNSKGNMLLLDQGGFRVLEFAPDGSFIRQISKRGMGDAELTRPQNFNITADDHAIVSEYRKGVSNFLHFDKDMNFVKREAFPKARLVLRSVVFAPNGQHFSAFYNAPGKQPGVTMAMNQVVMSPSLEMLQPLAESEVMAWNPKKITEGDWWVTYLSSVFGMVPTRQEMTAYDAKSRLYSANNGNYTITRWSADLKKELTFSKEYKPVKMTKEDRAKLTTPIHKEILSALKPDTRAIITEDHIQRAIEGANWPETMTPIFGLVPIADDHLLVVSKFNPTTEEAWADIFDEGGHFVGTTKLPDVKINVFGSYYGYGARMIVKGDQAYAITHKDGNMALTRYSYKRVASK